MLNELTIPEIDIEAVANELSALLFPQENKIITEESKSAPAVNDLQPI